MGIDINARLTSPLNPSPLSLSLSLLPLILSSSPSPLMAEKAVDMEAVLKEAVDLVITQLLCFVCVCVCVIISSFWRSLFIVAVDLCRKIYLWRRCLITCDAALEASPPSRPFSASKSSAPTSSRRSRCGVDSSSPPATPLIFRVFGKMDS